MNKTLENAASLRRYLVLALSMLESEAQKTAIPVVQQERFVFEKDGFGTDYVPVTLYRVFVQDRRALLDSLPHAQEVGMALFERSVYSRLAADGPSPFSLSDREKLASQLRNILVGSFLEQYNCFEVTDAQFGEHLERFGSVWQSNRVVHVVTVPLLRFRAPSPIHLESDFAIAPLTDTAKSKLWLPDIFNPQR